jgi:hypothetical protein
MDSRITSGSDAFRKACEAIDAPLRGIFYAVVRSSMSILEWACSCQRLRIRAARHQEVEVLAGHLFPVMSGDREKAVISENYRIVGGLCVRNHHRHSYRFSGDDERTKVLPKALDFGFGNFLFFGLVHDFRHTSSIGEAASNSDCH